MAIDKAITDLSVAEKIGSSDLFVIEQNNVAKSVSGAVLIDLIEEYSGGASIIPAGGTAGQFLVKNSATDYDMAWVTVPNAAGVSF